MKNMAEVAQARTGRTLTIEALAPGAIEHSHAGPDDPPAAFGLMIALGNSAHVVFRRGLLCGRSARQ
jgi:hypothetical protein